MVQWFESALSHLIGKRQSFRICESPINLNSLISDIYQKEALEGLETVIFDLVLKFRLEGVVGWSILILANKLAQWLRR